MKKLHKNELELPDMAKNDSSAQEILRVWIRPDDRVDYTVGIDPAELPSLLVNMAYSLEAPELAPNIHDHFIIREVIQGKEKVEDMEKVERMVSMWDIYFNRTEDIRIWLGKSENGWEWGAHCLYDKRTFAGVLLKIAGEMMPDKFTAEFERTE